MNCKLFGVTYIQQNRPFLPTKNSSASIFVTFIYEVEPNKISGARYLRQALEIKKKLLGSAAEKIGKNLSVWSADVTWNNPPIGCEFHLTRASNFRILQSDAFPKYIINLT